MHLGLGQVGPQLHEADLRAVAVGQDDPCAVGEQIRHRSHRARGDLKLVRYRRRQGFIEQGVASHGDEDCVHSGAPTMADGPC